MTRPPPRANPDLFGQEAAEKALLDAFNSGRMAHAWLISGPRGIGKATLAYRFARFVLSRGAESGAGGGGLFGEAPTPDSLRIDPESPLFQRVAAGGHADLITVERRADEKTGKLKSEIVVDDVRGIGAFMGKTAAEGGWRVAIVDSADEMNRNAANALLKVLEEPPRSALLLLIAHNPGRLLPTIRSRCRHLTLRPLDDQAVADLVSRWLPDVDGEEANTLARLAEGSPGRALSLAEEGGLELFSDVTGLLDGLPRIDIGRLHALGDKLARADADGAFRTMGDLLRWWLGGRILSGAKAGAIGGGLDPWLEVWEKTNTLLAQADGLNLDRKQVVVDIFLGLEGAART